MAGVMAPCGGLECMLNRLTGIKDFKQGRHLLTVSLPGHRGQELWGGKFHRDPWGLDMEQLFPSPVLSG